LLIVQARNIDGAFAIAKKPISNGSVLLVDDMVDSRWTITVASWLLRSNGSGEVFPIALALT
jgi:ATP-dependent DNA helicase RecQ